MDHVEIGEIEIELLLEAIFRRYGYDFLEKARVIHIGSSSLEVVELHKHFPEMKIDVWNANEFDQHLQAYATANVRKLTLYNAWFNEEAVAKYKGVEKIVFMNTSRVFPEINSPWFVLNMTEEQQKERQHINVKAHEVQKWWVKELNPLISILTFCPPWDAGKFEYFDGINIVEPFAAPATTETRLIVTDNTKMKVYDNTHYEGVANYHNAIVRYTMFPVQRGLSLRTSDGAVVIHSKLSIGDRIFPTLYIDGVMRYDDWRWFDILRQYIMTRIAYKSKIPHKPMEAIDQFQNIFVSPRELNISAVQLMKVIEDGLLFNQRDAFIERILNSDKQKYL